MWCLKSEVEYVWYSTGILPDDFQLPVPVKIFTLEAHIGF